MHSILHTNTNTLSHTTYSYMSLQALYITCYLLTGN
ncbi:hypothetical protein vBBak6_122 [Bacillus phage v_B-Bak6]|nr:hypothetical protein vBBak1_122 [Bacillus phage v_B-Bak1]AXY83202.1 hypothetical protein vBBak6_122 [Bacillus phage v_B-Bak6]